MNPSTTILVMSHVRVHVIKENNKKGTTSVPGGNPRQL
jgi:hypothetical protein